MADKQDQSQKVSENGVAIQSGRDTNIGINAQQMSVIMETLAKQLPAYAVMAREIVDARLKDLEERLLQPFAEDKEARAQAFNDPDFQYLLTRGQHAYARSGDNGIKEVLVDLIVERSKQSERSLLALSLNDAVEKSAILTANEFAEITLCFFMHSVNLTLWVPPSKLSEFISSVINPLLPLISHSNVSYTYMQSHGCGSVLQIAQTNFDDLFRAKFSMVFYRPLMIADAIDGLGRDLFNKMAEHKLICAIASGGAGGISNIDSVVFNAASRHFFENSLSEVGFDSQTKEKIKILADACMLGATEFQKKISDELPNFDMFKEAWDNTPMKNFTLTTTGIAIGHANFQRLSKMSIPLDTWIK